MTVTQYKIRYAYSARERCLKLREDYKRFQMDMNRVALNIVEIHNWKMD